MAQILTLDQLATVYPEVRNAKGKRFTSYPLSWTTLGASATSVKTLQISQNTTFFPVAVTGVVFASDYSAELAVPPFDISIFDNGRSAYLTKAAVSWKTFVGSAAQPGVWPWTYPIPGNTNVDVTLVNHVATAYNVFLDFIGFEIQ